LVVNFQRQKLGVVGDIMRTRFTTTGDVEDGLDAQFLNIKRNVHVFCYLLHTSSASSFIESSTLKSPTAVLRIDVATAKVFNARPISIAN
jgi:hypothetical protein